METTKKGVPMTAATGSARVYLMVDFGKGLEARNNWDASIRWKWIQAQIDSPSMMQARRWFVVEAHSPRAARAILREWCTRNDARIDCEFGEPVCAGHSQGRILASGGAR